jgi:hypothetical protein
MAASARRVLGMAEDEVAAMVALGDAEEDDEAGGGWPWGAPPSGGSSAERYVVGMARKAVLPRAVARAARAVAAGLAAGLPAGWLGRLRLTAPELRMLLCGPVRGMRHCRL